MMELVSTVTVGSGGAASIEFTNIPQTGKDLLVLLSGRGNSNNTALIRFNSDTGNNYDSKLLRGSGSTADSPGNTSADAFYLFPIPDSNYTSNTFGNAAITVSNYISSVDKSCSADGVQENNATSSRQAILAGKYATSSAITSVQLVADFVQHSTASLYIVS